MAILSVAFAASTIPLQLHAEEAGTKESGKAGLEEIIVTAQRREERLQEVPIAVAAVTAESLRNNGIDTTRDLPQMVPSVQFTRSGASGLFFVRGVGTTNAAVGEESSNAVYVDGVYLADLAQAINNFNNVERIEVLKGPQGTLFGRNATGGLVHIITREPGDELVASGEVGYANYDTLQRPGLRRRPDHRQDQCGYRRHQAGPERRLGPQSHPRPGKQVSRTTGGCARRWSCAPAMR